MKLQNFIDDCKKAAENGETDYEVIKLVSVVPTIFYIIGLMSGMQINNKIMISSSDFSKHIKVAEML